MHLGLVKWQPVILLVVFMFFAQLIGPEWLRYDTSLVRQNQWWRVASAHWVHANWTHYGLNMLGLVLCFAITSVSWSLWQWLMRVFFLSIGISLCFFVFQLEFGWYVGFSGVLFGLYVMAALDTLEKQWIISVVLLIFLGVKVTLEQVSSVKLDSSELIGVPVLVDAHLYGVALAIVWSVLQFMIYRFNALNKTGSK